MPVPGGGIASDGDRWIASRGNFLVHVHVLGHGVFPVLLPNRAYRVQILPNFQRVEVLKVMSVAFVVLLGPRTTPPADCPN
jgi:hypothetical protein